MAEAGLKQLVAKLNAICRQALDGAISLCVSRTHYNVEVEHWLQWMVEHDSSELPTIFQHYDISRSGVHQSLLRAIDSFKTGNSRPPSLSPAVVSWLQEAWVLASLPYGETQIRSSHMLLALLRKESLRLPTLQSCPELGKIPPDGLYRDLVSLTENSSEASGATHAQPAGVSAAEKRPSAGPTRTPSLDQFTVDLTEKARRGEIDPVLGRDEEIRQVVDILCRRRQNNPILTGEPGVGKTAVAEGLALRIADGDVPERLRQTAIRNLDLALLQAGAGVRGEFENRLRGVIEEVKSSPQPVILFIDEAHTLIGAGGQAGQGDAANLIKPALARGELRTIAATTRAEYKLFEKDAALARRFQEVQVEEPSEEMAIAMLRGLTDKLETHHGVRILSEAVEDAVKLSSRYISGRQLPDKAISLLDTTCARISLSQAAPPSPLEDCRRRIAQTQTTIDMLRRESLIDARHELRIRELEQYRDELDRQAETLAHRWQQEQELVERISQLRKALIQIHNSHQIESADSPVSPPSINEQQEAILEIQALEIELRDIQQRQPLVFACCDSEAVAQTVAAWTGIPVGRMQADEVHTILKLDQELGKSVIGQCHAISQIALGIRTSRAKLTDPSRPIGVFLLAGPSGVGKTETALSLAELLYGGEQNLTVLNMSEFKEEHKVSLLMGPPPGYVGYGQGGILTEAVRRKPYSVLLLDELEKAHPSFQDVFYQVFDKGHMRDSEGRNIDFKNTLIIMTSNAGSELIKSLCLNPETMPNVEILTQALHGELLKTFKPAFLGRTSIIPYLPLNDDMMRSIIELKLTKVARRLQDHYQANFNYTPQVVDAILSRCSEVDTGARNVDKILNRTLLPELSAELLSRTAEEQLISTVEVDCGPNGFEYRLQ
jgi:type VI secretion system protein VasG